MNYYIKFDESDRLYLAHYGIKGQKWGYRRFQNSDGTWTEEGKIRYNNSDGSNNRAMKRALRYEYRDDNRKAYQLGKHATIAARASSIAKKKLDRTQKRYDRKQNDRRLSKLNNAKDVYKKLDRESNRSKKAVEKNYQSLVAKYGDKAVSSIKYDRKGRVNERTTNFKDLREVSRRNFASARRSELFNTTYARGYVAKSKGAMAREAYNSVKRGKNATTAVDDVKNYSTFVYNAKRRRESTNKK